MVVDSNDNIKETISYYPFGSEMRMENPAQMQQTDNSWHPFRFTGKELDKQNGLNNYAQKDWAVRDMTTSFSKVYYRQMFPKRTF